MTSDEALYRAVRGGSADAFTQLYNRHESPLFGFILKRLGNRQDAEEVLQDAMLTILNGPLARFEPGGFSPWLYKVSLNLCLNRRRGSARRERNTARADAGACHGEDAGPADEQLIRAEEEKALAAGEGRLNAPLLSVYRLRRQGKSHEEISSELGIPVGTVKSRTSAIVGFLRKEIMKWNAK